MSPIRFQIRYVKRKDPQEILTLDEIREDVPESKWQFNKVFEEVCVAIDNRVDPDEFWSWPERRRAIYIAQSRVVSTMRQWQEKLDADQMKRK